VNFYHEWLNLWTKVSHGDKDIDADLMGRIAIRQLKMNSAEEFRAALRQYTGTLSRPERPVGRPTSGPVIIMPASLDITPEASQFIRHKGGQAVVDLICWKG
jgi:hypothetical protein